MYGEQHQELKLHFEKNHAVVEGLTMFSTFGLWDDIIQIGQ